MYALYFTYSKLWFIKTRTLCLYVTLVDFLIRSLNMKLDKTFNFGHLKFLRLKIEMRFRISPSTSMTAKILQLEYYFFQKWVIEFIFPQYVYYDNGIFLFLYFYSYRRVSVLLFENFLWIEKVDWWFTDIMKWKKTMTIKYEEQKDIKFVHFYE
jgi:hypothetical protein